MSVLWLCLLVPCLCVVVFDDDEDDDVLIVSHSVCFTKDGYLCICLYLIHCLVWAASFTKRSLK